MAAKAGRRLSKMWDRARDALARAGLRPYSVCIVRVRASGGRARGDGPTDFIAEWPLLPTPKVMDMTGVQQILDADSITELGLITLSGISLQYTEDVLLGRGEQGLPIPPDENVFYEIRSLDINGKPTARRRFVSVSAPTMRSESAEWTINLSRAPQDRGRNGLPR